MAPGRKSTPNSITGSICLFYGERTFPEPSPPKFWLHLIGQNWITRLPSGKGRLGKGGFSSCSLESGESQAKGGGVPMPYWLSSRPAPSLLSKASSTSSPGGRAARGPHVGPWALTDLSFCLSSAAWVPELPAPLPPQHSLRWLPESRYCGSGPWMRVNLSVAQGFPFLLADFAVGSEGSPTRK